MSRLPYHNSRKGQPGKQLLARLLRSEANAGNEEAVRFLIDLKSQILHRGAGEALLVSYGHFNQVKSQDNSPALAELKQFLEGHVAVHTSSRFDVEGTLQPSNFQLTQFEDIRKYYQEKVVAEDSRLRYLEEVQVSFSQGHAEPSATHAS